MKKQILFIAVLIATCTGYNANAQISVSVNIGTQPLWGPTGYDYVQYYYIPDMDAYYSVDQQTYTYMVNGQWVTTMEMPPMYRGYDLYHGYKVVVNEPRPWLHEARYHKQYAQYRGRHDQPFIRDAHDRKYYANPQHPQHAQWNGNGNHGNPGHGNGNHQQNNHPQAPVTHAPVQVNQGSTRPGSENHGPENHGNGNQPHPENHDEHGHDDHGHDDHGNGHDDHGGHR